MAKDLNDLRSKLDDEYGQVRRKLDKIQQAFDEVEKAGPEDDVFEALEKLEKVVHEVRTGGIVGSGAHGHRRARDEWLEAKQGKH
jgi:hypothetical protein